MKILLKVKIKCVAGNGCKATCRVATEFCKQNSQGWQAKLQSNFAQSDSYYLQPVVCQTFTAGAFYFGVSRNCIQNYSAVII